MNNDRIQGILFDQAHHVDLAPMNKRNQRLLRLRATGQYLQRTRKHSIVLVQKLNPLRIHRQHRSAMVNERYRLQLLDRIQPQRDRDVAATR